MKRYMKAVGLTAAIAVAIPLNAYAATGDGSNAAQEQVQTKTQAEVQTQAQTPTNSGAAPTQPTIGGTAQTPPAEGGIGGHRHRGHRAGFRNGGIINQDVLNLLKLDRTALKEKLAAGKTLAQIAQEQGVSRDRLKQALTDAFNKKQEAMKKNFTDNLDKIIDGKLQSGMGRSLGRGFFGKTDLSAVAATLGLTNEELKESLASGKTIADLAKEKGVDTQKLIDAQKAAIIESINQAVKDGKLTQGQADKRIQKSGTIAEKIVNGRGLDKQHGGGWKDLGQAQDSSVQDSQASDNQASGAQT